MALIFSLLGAVAGLVVFVASIFILIHAFQKSVAKGFMTLCIPCFIFYYLHTEFDHPKKQAIMTAFYVGFAAEIISNVLAQVMARG